mmetsp:Transcript_505/g.553  ORF Transcript_505/g.553 Transcript_505/m.553 type:complete len:530 (+) Transcript_505:540-2129(+)
MVGGNRGALIVGRHEGVKPEQEKYPQSELLFPNDSPIRKRSPAATIGGKTPHMLEFSTNRFVPGPGKYNPKDVRNERGVRFTNLPNLELKEKNRNRHMTPGPGTYKMRDDFGVGAKSVTILGRNNENSKKRNQQHFSPGPGAYDADKFNRTAGPSFTIKGAISQDPIVREKNKVPASCTYDPRDDYVKKNIPSISFGPRPPKPPKSGSKADGPGPGSYNLPSTLDTRKGIVISQNYFEGNQTLGRSRSFSGQRNTMGGKGTSIGKSKNRGLKGSGSGPGPGSYNLTSNDFGKNCKRNIILLARPKSKSDNNHNPGPGSYSNNFKSIGTGGKGIILLGRHKEKPILGKDSPGPGTYDLKGKTFDNIHGTISFGGGDRFRSPGGNSINPNGKGSNIDSGAPGPGTYDINQTNSGPKFSIGGVKENEQMFNGRNESPGPGTYNYKDDTDVRMKGGHFSSSKRPEYKPPLIPGPGTYSQSTKNLPSGPSFSLKGKIIDKDKEETPGPPHYYPNPQRKVKRRFHLYRKSRKEKM